MRRSPWVPFGLRLLMVAALIGALRLWPRSPPPLNDPQQLHRLERILDGKTLLVGGRRVRLLGVDAPELAHDGQPAEPGAESAREFLQAALANGTVSFGFDRDNQDNEGRRLVYAYHQGRLLNEELIRAGFSRFQTQFPIHEAMKTRFLQAEREAREQRRGLWSDE